MFREPGMMMKTAAPHEFDDSDNDRPHGAAEDDDDEDDDVVEDVFCDEGEDVPDSNAATSAPGGAVDQPKTQEHGPLQNLATHSTSSTTNQKQ